MFKKSSLFSNVQKELEEKIEKEALKISVILKNYENEINERQIETQFQLKTLESNFNQRINNYETHIIRKNKEIDVLKAQYKMVQLIFKQKLDDFISNNENLKNQIYSQEETARLKIQNQNYKNTVIQDKIQELTQDLNSVFKENQFLKDFQQKVQKKVKKRKLN